MHNFQAFLILVSLFVLQGIMVSSLVFTINQIPLKAGRLRYLKMMLGLLGTGCFLWASYAVLEQAPAFDWGDYCRPHGIGVCMNGQSFSAAEKELENRIFYSFLGLVSGPLLVLTAIALGVQAIRRKRAA